MESRLRSVEHKGAHEAGGAPRGAGAPPPSWIGGAPPDVDLPSNIHYIFQNNDSLIFRSFQELLFLHKNNTIAILLKTTSVRVSSILIMVFSSRPPKNKKEIKLFTRENSQQTKEEREIFFGFYF